MQDLGTTLLSLLAGDPATIGDVGTVVIHDPADPAPLGSRAFVLGVGLSNPAAVHDLLPKLQRDGAVALVVREPFEVDAGLRSAVQDAQIVLFGLAPGAVWHQLTTLLSVSLAEANETSLAPDTLGTIPTGDLFGVANAICALVDAPITIEDRNSRVVAFSDRQDEADFVRIESILGRRTPDHYAREDELRGAMRAIRSAARPVYLEPIELDDAREALPRAAVAVRAGDEVLGAIWAVVREPLTPDQEDLLLDASRVVALHMLQIRTGPDAEQRRISDLVATALEGGFDAATALARLGIERRPCVVVAVATTQPRAAHGGFTDALELARLASERERTASSLMLHLSATRSGSVVAVLRDTVYAIIPVGRVQDAENSIEATCRAFLQRNARQTPMVIGIGRIAHEVRGLSTSRADADRAVRVLRSRDQGGVVAQAADVDVDALVLELRDLAQAGGREPSGSYALLLAYDRARKAFMVETLQAWLNARGDIVTAAAASHMHPNTFRYRLKRLSEIGEFDLDDADACFALELQLRMFPPHEQLSGPDDH